MQFSSGTGSAAVGSTVSCVVGFDLHGALGMAGQIIGIASGLLTIGWVIYQWAHGKIEKP